jgi:hypothetical protein
VKRSLHINTGNQEDVTIVNIYSLTIDVPNFTTQIQLGIKGQLGTIIEGGFNVILSLIDRSSRPKKKSKRNFRVKLYHR